MYWRDVPYKTFKPSWIEDLPVSLINRYARFYNIDAVFLAAVVKIESGGNPNAVRFEPNYQYTSMIRQLADAIECSPATMEVMQKTSWGLMQVMGSVAFELGLAAEKDFNNRWPTSLLIPERGMTYGCMHLKKKINAYGNDVDTVYAAYNAGSPRMTESGGFFVNQTHVNKFRQFYNALGGDA